ncbi:endo alpha-1,4 polygalactosaminidase [Marinomonas mediterranea]|uniref:endo alpha-1,4 polygalactosaminidase n=1 Tax=Marinomonas mediterranea TaxID=119864 RepID=UPI00234B41B0|nr:endo alpha-1,4 polygalactosaminidase [Marinomonas mediterranea]WCN10939.1 endo alpha-1,4 polygalactosaminidase [Marinomonas mediterranea]
MRFRPLLPLFVMFSSVCFAVGKYQPVIGDTWQWQLQGTLNTDYNATVYDIDLFDTSWKTIRALHAKRHKVICYFSAGTYEEWRDDKDRFKPEHIGTALDDWKGEYWIDIRARHIKKVMIARLDLAKKKGCDGVEPDNVDGYLKETGFNLTYDDQIAFNRFLAGEAHQRGMIVALKNDLDQVAELVSYFDLAINEQCFEFDECDKLQPFIDQNKPVFNAEYKAEWANNGPLKQRLCDDAKKRQIQTLVLPLALDDSYRYACP